MVCPPRTIRFAAVGDLHCTKDSAGDVAQLLRAGRRGRRRAAAVRRPHRLRHAGRSAGAGRGAGRRVGARSSRCSATTTTNRARRTRCGASSTDAGVHVLDGEACEVHGVGIAGAKGFCRRLRTRLARALGRAGDQAVRQRGDPRGAEARVGARQAAHAASASRCCTTRRSPAPCEGEPLEIFPFLGSSRLEEPLLRYPVDGGVPRPCAPRRAGGQDGQRRCRSTTWRSRCCSAPFRRGRRSGW